MGNRAALIAVSLGASVLASSCGASSSAPNAQIAALSSQVAALRMRIRTVPTPTVTVTVTAPASTVPAAVPTTAPAPQGSVTLDRFENGLSGPDPCSNTTLYLTNRSNTAVATISVTFTTSYASKDTGNYQDGPTVGPLTKSMGFAPFQSGSINYAVCVPSLAGHIQAPGGIDAVPTYLSWTWFQQ